MSDSPQSTRTPTLITYGEHWRRKWLKRLTVWGLVLLVVGVVGFYFGPKAYHRVKIWRAHKLVEQAKVLKEGGLASEMRDKLLKAYLLADNDPEVLRVMAKEYATTPAEALQFRQRLALVAESTLQDRIDLCTLAVDNRLTAFVKADFERLMKDPEAAKDPKVAELIARYHTLQGEWSEALKWTGGGEKPAEGGKGELTEPSVANQSPRLNLIRAKLLLDAPQPDQAALAKTAEEVTALMSSVLERGEEKEQREAGLLLARVYVTLPAMRKAMGEPMARKLLTELEPWFEEPKWEARLVAADLEIFLEAGKKDALVEAFLKRAPKVDEATQQELARWLTRRGLPDKAEVLAQAAPERAQNRDWFLIRMDAMATQKKWAEIEKVLLDPVGVPIEEALGRLFLWRCAKEGGANKQEAERRLEQALAVCNESPPGVGFYAAGYLEQLGERSAASKLYRRLSDVEAFSGPAYVGLVRTLGADPKQSEALREALEKMLARFPGVKEGRNDLAYLNLLEGRKVSESIQAAAELVAEAPQMLAFRTTMALAELVRGNAKSADSIYNGVDLDWTTVNPGWVAVRASVLAANGKMEEARLLAGPLNPDQLRDGEKRLLDKYLKATTQAPGAQSANPAPAKVESAKP